MSELVCLNCERTHASWRAGERRFKCVCGQYAWVTWHQFVKRAIRQMRHGL